MLARVVSIVYSFAPISIESRYILASLRTDESPQVNHIHIGSVIVRFVKRFSHSQAIDEVTLNLSKFFCIQKKIGRPSFERVRPENK